MQSKFEGAYKQLNAEQRLAVDTIDGPVLVIAGPGTGKTQLLSIRIANILNKTDTLPENILCLTFTDSAVHTMRERLSSIIGQAAYAITISTYHAFGSELLRRYPDYFTGSADLAPADDLAIDAAVRFVMERAPYKNPLKHETFLRDVKQLISDAKRALLTPDDLRAIASANQRFISEATTRTHELSSELTRVSKTSVPTFKKLLDIPTGSAIKTHETVILPLGQLWQESLSTALASFEETGKTTALSKWKLKWLAKDAKGLFIADGTLKNAKISAAADLYQAYLAELQRQGLYDYDDMILRAIRGLEDNPELRFTLQERYLYLLLDEFQDTNEAQDRLVALLTDNPASEGRPNVLAVGDDDQAIYAFQGADYSHMLNFYERYKDVLVVPLVKNYRSHQQILDVSAQVAGQIDGRLEQQFKDINKTIEAATVSLPQQPHIERREFKSALSQNAWTAKRIARLIKDGTPPREIAVIAPKHEYLQAIVPYLRQLTIPMHYDKRENVLDDPAIDRLVIMSELIVMLASNSPGANSLWPQVLSYDFWELPTSLIWQLSWQSRDDRRSLTDILFETPETRAIALFFVRLSQVSLSMPLEQVMDALIGVTALELNDSEQPSYTSPYASHYFGDLTLGGSDTVGYWQLLSNLTILREHLRGYRKNELEPLLIADFLGFVAAAKEAGIKVLNTNPYQEALDAVELTTAYHAKGQEYTAVFLLGMQDEIWGTKARALGSRLSLPQNLEYIRYAGTTEDERLRLLYVAITRAKSELYMVSYSSTFAGKPTTHLQYLNEAYDENGALISPLLPAGAQKVVFEEPTDIPSLLDVQISWQQQHYQALSRPDVAALLAPRLQRYQISPTELNTFLDVEHAGPDQFFLRTLLRFPMATTPSIEFGNAIHQTLEWIHITNKNKKSLPTDKQILAFFEKNLQQKRLGAVQTELLLERGQNALRSYIAQRSETITPNALCEYSFRNEAVFIGPAHLSGKIDKLIIDEKNKTVVIVDYKTGRSHNRWEHSAKLHFYCNQLYFYRLLVEHSRRFRGYTVTDAYLEFVEPDEQGIIQELHSTFDESAMKDFEALISCVWEHVQALSFPPVETYTLNLKGIEQFEADLRAGTI